MRIENKHGHPLPEQIDHMLHQFIEESLKTYRPHIRKIILYGSYARGDFRKESYIDIMVLVDYPREEVGEHMTGLSDISFEISFKNDFIEINPVMQNADFFDKWVKCYPFYNNVLNEGVQLYGC